MARGGYRPGSGRKKGVTIAQNLREYGAEEKHPAWFLSSYTDNVKLRRAYDVSEQKF